MYSCCCSLTFNITNNAKFPKSKICLCPTMFTKAVVLFAAFAFAKASLEENYLELFQDFKLKYHPRGYSSSAEESRRLEIFKAAMKTSDERNVKNGQPIFGVTKFSDRTKEEFSALLGRKSDSSKKWNEERVKAANAKTASGSSLPSYINWAEKGAVTPVKNQGQCGSCWAFSAAEQIESQWALSGQALWEFSPQQVASCTTNADGCGGGYTEYAFDYIASTVGLGSAWFAPYVQSMYVECLDATCTESCSAIDVDALYNPTDAYLSGPYASISGYEYATPPCLRGKCSSQDTALLAEYVANNGPASICVNAENWGNYVGGVMTGAACGGNAAYDIDHCVQLVGYNHKAPTPYWIVRNSWATDWGEDGYIYLEFPNNACGLANEATYVFLTNATNSKANQTKTA